MHVALSDEPRQNSKLIYIFAGCIGIIFLGRRGGGCGGAGFVIQLLQYEPPRNDNHSLGWVNVCFMNCNPHQFLSI